MIEAGNIYRFTYKKQDKINNIVYGLVFNNDNNISIIHLNGFLGNQYKHYNVMREDVLFNDKIISYETSSQIYKKFIPHAHYIMVYVLDILSKMI